MEGMVNNLLPFFENKKIFITGHTGFKGSWLSTILINANAIVKGYALKPTFKNIIYENLLSKNNFFSIIDDIRNKKKLEDEILNFEPDFIFHLAAQPLVRKSYIIPSETFEVNVIGTTNCLESVIKLKKKATVIVITTDKVYENKEQHILYKEEDTLGGYDPYSASKAATEIAVNAFRKSFFNKKKYAEHKKTICTARAGNVIGGGDYSEDRLIPDIVKSLQNNIPVEVRNPNSIRPWQHVLEPLFGYLQLAKISFEGDIKIGDTYNFGPEPNDHLTVQQLVETSINIFAKGSWLDKSDKNALHEAKLLMLDINKAKKDLHWQPKLNSQDAVQWTMDWYKQDISNLEIFTIQQIKDYADLWNL